MGDDAWDFERPQAARRGSDKNERWPEARGETEATSARARAIGLGWFSVLLGTGQIVAPAAVATLIGARPNRANRSILQTFGARELTAGLGLLARPRAGWLWARVAGDVMDIAVLAAMLGKRKRQRASTWLSLASVAGVTLLDAKTAWDQGKEDAKRTAAARRIHLTAAITINRPPDEVYRFWHDFRNLPQFMDHIESVEMTDGHSRWRAKGPARTAVEWEAETTIDRPGQMIAWRSSEGTALPNTGSVTFAPAAKGLGTNLRVELRYDPPAGRLGAAIAKFFSEVPEQMIKNDLRRLKQIMETGEVVHSDASIHQGRHPARPAGDDEHTRRMGR